MGPQRRADGTLVIGFPTADKRIPWIGAEDIGRSAFGIFARGTSLAGMTIGIAGEHLTGAELAHQLSAALDEPVRYEAMTPEAYRAPGHEALVELANMWQFKRDCEALLLRHAQRRGDARAQPRAARLPRVAGDARAPRFRFRRWRSAA